VHCPALITNIIILATAYNLLLLILTVVNFGSQKRLEKVREIEKKVWNDEMTDLKAMVESELGVMRTISSWSSMDTLNGVESIGTRLPAEGVEDNDDDLTSFDVESFRLVLPPEDVSIPEMYLLGSPLPGKESPDG